MDPVRSSLMELPWTKLVFGVLPAERKGNLLSGQWSHTGAAPLPPRSGGFSLSMRKLQEKPCPLQMWPAAALGCPAGGQEAGAEPSVPLLLPLVARRGNAGPVPCWSKSIGHRRQLLLQEALLPLSPPSLSSGSPPSVFPLSFSVKMVPRRCQLTDAHHHQVRRENRTIAKNNVGDLGEKRRQMQQSPPPHPSLL